MNKHILQNKVSLFSNAKDTVLPTILSVSEILDNIKFGKDMNIVCLARHYYLHDLDKYKLIKTKEINGFTMSAHCRSRQSSDKERLVMHSSILQIDIDNVPADQLDELRNKLNSDPHTFFSFLSLSGFGFKLGILIDPDKHKESFLQAEKYYFKTYGIKIDPSVKDIFRLCFISYDPDLYLNTNAKYFEVTEVANVETNTLDRHHELIEVVDQARIDKVFDFLNNLIGNSEDGSRYSTRLKVGNLLGGLIANKYFETDYAVQRISNAVMKNTDSSKDVALKPILNGIQNGMLKPLTLEDFYSVSLPFCFWHEKSSSGKPVLHIDTYLLIEFLKSEGYCFYKDMLIRICNNIIYRTSEFEIKSLITNHYIELLPDKISENLTKKDLHKYLSNNLHSILDKSRLTYLKSYNLLDFSNDRSDSSIFYFKNGFVEVTVNDIKLKPYSELNGLIWYDNILKRDFLSVLSEDDIDLNKSDFVRFCMNICSERRPVISTFDFERYCALRSTLGYLLHRYKSESNNFAVVFTEENLDTDTASGGTGKSLLAKALGMLRKLTKLDGKKFTFFNQFCFQDVDIDTQIISFDDINKNFEFENLFSLITEGIEIEKKFQSKISLKYENSPKICLGSNYPITDESTSSKRRKFEMELYRYYDYKHKPEHEFGKLFFVDWDNKEWNYFDNFMLYNTQYFLKHQKIQKYKSNTLQESKLINSLGLEFVEYADTITRDKSLKISELYQDYLDYTDLNPNNYSKIKFRKDLEKYCSLKKISLIAKCIRDNGYVSKCYVLTGRIK